MDGHNLIGVWYILLRKLGEVYQAVFLDTYIDEGTEISDVAYNARKYHSFAQVVDRTYVLIKFEYLNGFTRVTSRFVEFL